MQKWYLITNDTRPNLSGGFENEGYNDYVYDSFYELLATDLCPTVKICDSNLSNEREVKCLVIGNSADTQLKTLQRTAIFPKGVIKAGMYVIYENTYWIVDGYPGDCTAYEKITMKLCQYKLRWQNKKGDIIERWANFTSASKYDVGETGTNIILVSSNNYTVIVPYDDDCLGLDEQRLFIDQRDIPKKVFKFTREDDVLFTFNEAKGGVLNFIADKVAFNPETDNQELRICDYFTPVENEPPAEDDEIEISSSIKYKFKTVYIGRTSTFEAVFKTKTGEVINKTPKWSIESDFDDSINIEEIDSKINILVTDNKLDGKSFTLSLTSDDGTSTTATMTIDIQSIL